MRFVAILLKNIDSELLFVYFGAKDLGSGMLKLSRHPKYARYIWRDLIEEKNYEDELR